MRALFLGLVVTGLAAGSARADIIWFSTVMTPGQEIPPPNVAGFNPSGTAYAILNTDTNQIQFDLTWTGLTTNATAAHIHTHSGGPPFTGPVLIGIPGISGTSGSATPTVLISNAQETALLAALMTNRVYFNLHTTQNPPGEIRGNITSFSTPEPSSLVVLGLGVVGLAGVRRLRRAAT